MGACWRRGHLLLVGHPLADGIEGSTSSANLLEHRSFLWRFNHLVSDGQAGIQGHHLLYPPRGHRWFGAGSTIKNHGKIEKVCWLVESFSRISQSLYYNGHVCIVDKIMVLYKGRFYNIRQYMKSKPVKWGIKLWALASNKSRYVPNVIIYKGAPIDWQTWEEEASSVGE